MAAVPNLTAPDFAAVSSLAAKRAVGSSAWLANSLAVVLSAL